MHFKIGTRGSKLALWQADYIAGLLNQAGHETEIIKIQTKGDRILDVSISKIGSKGVFTEEIEIALKEGIIDIAVHSAKDMPSELPDGFSLIAFTEREKPNDVVVSHKPDFRWDPQNIPVTVGTSSTRRIATLKHFYPLINNVDIRGNLQTRIRKMEEGLCDAIILAYAGVHRMAYDNMIAAELPLTEFTPAVGQGIVTVEIHKNLDQLKIETLRNIINHKPTEQSILAERAYLKKLKGGCSIPAFAYASHVKNDLVMTAGITDLKGMKRIVFELKDKPENGLTLGSKLGDLVLESGGGEILKQIKSQAE